MARRKEKKNKKPKKKTELSNPKEPQRVAYPIIQFFL
jgi:hypothetical protein